MPTLRVYVRNVYGRPLAYPIKDEVSDAIATLSRRKTYEPKDLEAIKTLGIAIQQTRDPNTPTIS